MGSHFFYNTNRTTCMGRITMTTLQDYLRDPENRNDAFWDSDELIWVDWREYDESIIKYVNKKLPKDHAISFRCVENNLERGVDILLKKNDVRTPIPYARDATDRDTTLRSMQEYLAPDYQIRWFMGSLGSDTLAFVVKTSDEWLSLEKEFGKDKVDFYFAPIDRDSVMFEMDMNEVFDLLEKRGES